MKSNLYTSVLFVLLLFPAATIGQTVSDRTETSCSGESKSIYQEIGGNKVIFVVAAAVDCGSCQNEAPDVAAFQEAFSQNVSVWGAMNRLFGSTDCSGSNAWKNQFGWEDIFMFLDNEDHWVSGGFTYFTVINPQDTSIAYAGLDFEQARSEAESLSQIVGIKEPPAVSLRIRDAYPNPFGNEITLKFNVLKTELIKVRLFDIIGQEVLSKTLELKPYMKELKLDLVDLVLQDGVYLLRIEDDQEVTTIRMIRD